MSKIEYVRSSWRNRDFVRRRPYHRDLPTPKMLDNRRRFGLATQEAIEKYGKKMIGAKQVPSSAAVVREILTGKKAAMTPEEALIEALAEAQVEWPLEKEQALVESLAELRT